MSKLTFDFEDSHPVTNLTKGDISSMKPEIKMKKILRPGYSFECKHIYTFKFNLSESEEIKISIQDLKFSAFRKYNNTSDQFNEKFKVHCDVTKKAKAGNDIIPIAVGGVLTGVLIISLVGYMVLRSRKT